MRLDQTRGEKALWRALREFRKEGVHVRRQAPIGPYVADFAMLSRKLVVEVDGDLHGMSERQSHDQRRDAWMRSQGFQVLRYSAQDVEDNLEGVVLDIRRVLDLD